MEDINSYPSLRPPPADDILDTKSNSEESIENVTFVPVALEETTVDNYNSMEQSSCRVHKTWDLRIQDPMEGFAK